MLKEEIMKWHSRQHRSNATKMSYYNCSTNAPLGNKALSNGTP